MLCLFVRYLGGTYCFAKWGMWRAVNSKDADTKLKPKIIVFYFSSKQEKELAGRKEQAK